MDSQQRALLDEIIADPDNDLPRMIFADWLEEAGDPRGEFIRLQCELASSDNLDSRFLDLSHRCEQLLWQHRKTWLAELNQDTNRTQFHRGFVDHITMRARAFVQNGETLFRSTPAEWLRPSHIRGAGSKLADCKTLRLIRRLDLSGLTMPEEDVCQMLGSPHLCNLLSLKIGDFSNPVATSIGEAITKMASVPVLESLEVYADEATFDAPTSESCELPSLRHLGIKTGVVSPGVAGLPRLRTPKLESLALSLQFFSSADISLVELPFSQLKRFKLVSWRPPAEVITAIAEKGVFNSVEDLDLWKCDVDGEIAASIFRSDQLSRCHTLSLGGGPQLQNNRASFEMIQQMCVHRPLSGVRRLRMCNLDHSDLGRIVLTPSFAQLESLKLSVSRFDIHDMLALAKSPVRETLRELKLARCEFEDEAKELAAIDFPQLLRLDLSYKSDQALTDANVIDLIASKGLQNLQFLALELMDLSDDVLDFLAERAQLPNLRELRFGNNNPSAEAITRLLHSENTPRLSRVLLSRNELSESLQEEHGARIQFED